MTDSTQVQQTNQPVDGQPNQPPAQQQANLAPPPPPANTNYDGAFASLQQSVDGLGESFISGMKEAFPILSQPPAAAQAQQVDDAASQAQQVDAGTGANAVVEDTDKRSWLAKKWFS